MFNTPKSHQDPNRITLVQKSTFRKGQKRLEVEARDAGEYMGAYVEFLFYPGWEDPEHIQGKLVGVSSTDPKDQDQYTYLTIATAEDETNGYTFGTLGMMGLSHTDLIHVFI